MRDITLCHPRIQTLAAKLIAECAKQGLKIATSETYRTVEEQNALYAQGRTTPGKIVTNAQGSSYSSYHQWGTAFDFYMNDGLGAFSYTSNGKERVADFNAVGAIGKSLGLEWGGDWKSPIDKPHFQLPDWGSTTAGIKKLYKDPTEFMKTWHKQPVGWIHNDIGWYYLYENGSYKTNSWDKINGDWYWFNESGYAYMNQWVKDGNDWFYLDGDCKMVTGLRIINNKLYYFKENGAMTTLPVGLTLVPDANGELHEKK